MPMKRAWAWGDPPTIEAEERFWQQGLPTVAGLDEAGRGPWAGPVWAGAVVLPALADIPEILVGVRDSKALTLRRREVLLGRIRAVALAVGDGSASVDEIDALGIVSATRLAMQRALGALSVRPQALILDAITLPHVALPQDSFPRADARSITVAVLPASSPKCCATGGWWSMPRFNTPAMALPGTRDMGRGSTRRPWTVSVCPLHRRSFQPIADRLDRAS